jgi:hypothetical protein
MLMIDKGYLTAKLKEIGTWKGQQIVTGTVELIFKDFQDESPQDLDAAILEMKSDAERFTPARLKYLVSRIRYSREEREWEKTKEQDREQAIRFFDESRYTGKCDRTKCLGCPHLKNCQVRGREWIRGINAIMNGGLGKKGSEELIRYMKNDFMGGTYAKPQAGMSKKELKEELPF